MPHWISGVRTVNEALQGSNGVKPRQPHLQGDFFLFHPKGKKKTCSGRTSANDLCAKEAFWSFNTRNKNYAWLHFTGWTFGLHSLSVPLVKGRIGITASRLGNIGYHFCHVFRVPTLEQSKRNRKNCMHNS